MKKSDFSAVCAASLLLLAGAAPSRADNPAPVTTCQDGTTSTASGRGACSGHGGKAKPAAAPASPAAPASAATAPPATAAVAEHAGVDSRSSAAATTAAKSPQDSSPAVTTQPVAGATAKCKDGTYSKSQHHAGSCSHHGGVAQWLTPAQ